MVTPEQIKKEIQRECKVLKLKKGQAAPWRLLRGKYGNTPERLNAFGVAVRELQDEGFWDEHFVLNK
jgi:hypothetical protein